MKGGGEGYSAKVGLINSLCRIDPDFKFEHACLGSEEIWRKHTYAELRIRLTRLQLIRFGKLTPPYLK